MCFYPSERKWIFLKCLLFLCFLCLSDALTLQISGGLRNNGSVAINFQPSFTGTIPNYRNVAACTWEWGKMSQDFIEFVGITQCISSATLAKYNITCTATGTTLTSTFKPAPVTVDLTVTLKCSPSNEQKTFHIKAKNCSRNSSNGKPSVQATDYTYNASGQFVCLAGQELFYSNSTPGITNTICQSDATWFGSSGLECRTESIISFVSPQNNSIVVVGGRIPAINAVLTFPPGLIISSCKWNNGAPFYAGTSCRNVAQVTCSQLNNNVINTSYVDSSIASSSLMFSVSCDLITAGGKFVPAKSFLHIVVKDCPTYLSSMAPVVKPTIKANTFTYQSRGQFDCGSATLFNQDGSVALPETECLNNASWKHGSVVECWTAPLVHLVGSVAGKAGSFINFSCVFNQNVYPFGDRYKFFLNKVLLGTYLFNQAFILNLTHEMNGKTLQCQAITKYTKIRPDEGWSQPHTLNISYTPYLLGDYKCIGNEPCNITLSSNPSPHEANLMTGNESKPVTWIKQSNSTHVVQINEPAGNYKLLVSNSVGQTSLSVVISSTNTYPPPVTNSALIIGISVAGVVVIGVIIFAVLAWIRKRKTKPGKDSVEFKKSEAVYVNTQVYENTESQQNTPEYQNIHGTDNTGNVEKAHLYEVPITLHSEPDNN